MIALRVDPFFRLPLNADAGLVLLNNAVPGSPWTSRKTSALICIEVAGIEAANSAVLKVNGGFRHIFHINNVMVRLAMADLR